MRGVKLDLSNGTKECPKCSEVKPLDAFSPNKHAASGYSSYCRPCMAAAARAFRATPEGQQKHRESNQRWVDSLEGKARLAEGFKVCPKCQTEKTFADYPKNKRTKHGIGSYCSACTVAEIQAYRDTPGGKQAHRAASNKWREANIERHKDNNAKRAYGLAHGTYDTMFAAQGGKCAICDTSDLGRTGRFSIDHCHSSGQVRGLLCDRCNRGIGHFDDSPDKLLRAIAYLSPKPS